MRIFYSSAFTLLLTVSAWAQTPNPCANDVVPPVLTCPSNITVGMDNDQCNAVVYFPIPQAVDNCSGATVSQTDATGLTSGSVFPAGVTTLSYSATDAAGNSTSCSFTVTVIDQQDPNLPCLNNIVVNSDPSACGAVVNFTAPVATDNCVGVSTVQSDGLPSGSLFPVGTTLMSFVATDAAGNQDSCTFQVVVQDNQAPILNCPSNITTNTDPGVCGAVVTFNPPTVIDNCSNTTIYQVDGLASGSVFPVGSTTVSYLVTDGSGNIDSCFFTVTVVDNELPVISCPGNISLNSDPQKCGATVTFSVTATDNCPGYTINQTDGTGLSSGSFFPIGTTNLSFEVVDASGNTSTCNFSVQITDAEAPTLTCPNNFTVPLITECSWTLIDYTTIVIGADNCGGSSGVTLTQTPPAGLEMFDGDVQTVTIDAVDAYGNASSCSFTISVEDAVEPTVDCSFALDTVKADTSCSFEVIDYTSLITVSDNCDDPNDFVFTQIPSAGSIVQADGPFYTIEVLVTGPDGFSYSCYNNLEVTCAVKLFLSESFSPNNDGFNDTWDIPGLEEFPNNHLRVFNRYGDLVYQAQPYMKDWGGVATEGTIPLGEGNVLPEGTYFYMLDLGNGEDPFTGYVYLRK